MNIVIAVKIPRVSLLLKSLVTYLSNRYYSQQQEKTISYIFALVSNS